MNAREVFHEMCSDLKRKQNEVGRFHNTRTGGTLQVYGTNMMDRNKAMETSGAPTLLIYALTFR